MLWFHLPLRNSLGVPDRWLSGHAHHCQNRSIQPRRQFRLHSAALVRKRKKIKIKLCLNLAKSQLPVTFTWGLSSCLTELRKNLFSGQLSKMRTTLNWPASLLPPPTAAPPQYAHTCPFVLLSEYSTINIHGKMSDIGWGCDFLR